MMKQLLVLAMATTLILAGCGSGEPPAPQTGTAEPIKEGAMKDIKAKNGKQDPTGTPD